MLLGIVSDTHGHVPYAREAIRVLEEFAPQAVLHCGDIGGPDIVPLFAAWPTHFVLGNVDLPDGDVVRAIEQAGQSFHGEFGAIELGGRRIALLHGHDLNRLRREIASGAWDLVCHGHTHVRHVERREQTLIVNPGALYRAQPHSLAIVELATMEVSHVTL